MAQNEKRPSTPSFDAELFGNISEGVEPEICAEAKRQLLLHWYAHRPFEERPQELRSVKKGLHAPPSTKLLVGAHELIEKYYRQRLKGV